MRCEAISSNILAEKAIRLPEDQVTRECLTQGRAGYTSLWRRRMGTKLSKQTRRELLEALCERYRNAAKIDKTKILD